MVPDGDDDCPATITTTTIQLQIACLDEEEEVEEDDEHREWNEMERNITFGHLHTYIHSFMHARTHANREHDIVGFRALHLHNMLQQTTVCCNIQPTIQVKPNIHLVWEMEFSWPKHQAIAFQSNNKYYKSKRPVGRRQSSLSMLVGVLSIQQWRGGRIQHPNQSWKDRATATRPSLSSFCCCWFPSVCPSATTVTVVWGGEQKHCLAVSPCRYSNPY